MKTLTDELHELIDPECTTVIAGDLNQPHIDWDTFVMPGKDNNATKESILVDFCTTHGLAQYVTEPTRCTQDTESLLDIVRCNDESVSKVQVLPNPLRSDHHFIKFAIACYSAENITSAHIKLDYEKGDFSMMKWQLDHVDWISFFEDCKSVNEMYQKFSQYLRSLIESHTPPRNIRSHPVSKQVIRLHQALTTAKDERTVQFLQRELARVSRRERVLREYSILRNPKYKAVHSYVRRRIAVNDTLSSVRRLDGTFTTNDKEKAEILKKHFEETYPDEDELRRRQEWEPPTMPQGPIQYVVHDVDVSPENIRLDCGLFATSPASTEESKTAV